MGAVELDEGLDLDFSKKIGGKNIAFFTAKADVGKGKLNFAVADPDTRYPFICRSRERAKTELSFIKINNDGGYFAKETVLYCKAKNKVFAKYFELYFAISYQ